MRDSLKAP